MPVPVYTYKCDQCWKEYPYWKSAVLCEIAHRDSDASLAEDPKGLSGKAMPARAEGIAQDISPEPLTERWD